MEVRWVLLWTPLTKLYRVIYYWKVRTLRLNKSNNLSKIIFTLVMKKMSDIIEYGKKVKNKSINM